ncbi:hypothetical protein ABE83_34525 [Streptomyces sp. CFMR 7]|nr:hypothetical protein ABE83_34525 [Streptomyces sp. CFMR 7]
MQGSPTVFEGRPPHPDGFLEAPLPDEELHEEPLLTARIPGGGDVPAQDLLRIPRASPAANAFIRGRKASRA